MKRVLKKTGKVLLIILIVLLSLLAIIAIWNQIALAVEKGKIVPLGVLVEVDGYNMHVWVDGEKNGKPTLVYLRGHGDDPYFSARPLLDRLSGEYQVAVVEHFGYGFSDNANLSRDVATVMRQYRAALQQAGVAAPYVLLPFSYSGVEAVYHAQEHPDEIAAIIGLDCSVPMQEAEEGYWGNAFLESLALNLGAIRVISWIDADFSLPPYEKYSDTPFFTDNEKAQYRYLLYRFASRYKILHNEAKATKANKELTYRRGAPDIPILHFIALRDANEWRGDEQTLENYINSWLQPRYDLAEKHDNVEVIEIDGGHGFFIEEPAQTAETILEYLERVLR